MCHDDAYCMDTDGSYECMCKEGYSGNGTHCIGKLMKRTLLCLFIVYLLHSHLLQILMNAVN